MTDTERLTKLLRDFGLEPYGRGLPRAQCIAVNSTGGLHPELTDYSVDGFVCYWPDIAWKQSTT